MRFVVVPEQCLYALPDGLGLERAVLVEPLSIALHAIMVARARPACRDYGLATALSSSAPA